MVVDLIVLLLVALIIGGAIVYIRNEKKRGVTCIGCPHAAECAKKKQGGCGADTSEKNS